MYRARETIKGSHGDEQANLTRSTCGTQELKAKKSSRSRRDVLSRPICRSACTSLVGRRHSLGLQGND